MSVQVLYRTSATASGGREGEARSSDDRLAVALSVPKELGGDGGKGTNPEQLFAAGYAACFLSAIKATAAQTKTKIPAEATVSATVGIGPRSAGGYGLTVALSISLPGIAPEEARKIVDAAHEVCPYSNATRNNVDVALTVA